MTKVSNPQDVAAYLKSLHPDERVGDLLVLALQRAVLRVVSARYPQEDVLQDLGLPSDHGPVTIVFDAGKMLGWYENHIRHVLDWIVSDVAEDADWLRRTDASGRPLKLLKLGSLNRALSEADKAMNRRLSRAGPRPQPQRGEGEKLFRTLDDGWSLVGLTTPGALDAESAAMRHCVGQGAYDHHLAKGSRLFLSLRDPAGRPHATLEIDTRGKGPIQIQGKGNAPLVERHAVRLLPYLRTLPISSAVAQRLGLVSTGGMVFHPSDLPDDVSTDGTLTLRLDDGSKLPKASLVVDGDLTIVSGAVSPVLLPPILHATGALRLSGHFALPPGVDLEVKRLHLVGGRTTGLPPGTRLSVLDLVDVGPLELPEDLVVEGSLSISGRGPTRLPCGSMPRTISLSCVEDFRLPAKLELDGDLTIRNSRIAAWPESIDVRGAVRISGAGLHRVPSGIRSGNLVVNAESVFVPDGTMVGVGATITAKRIVFGRNVVFERGLTIAGASGTILHGRLTVAGGIRMDRCIRTRIGKKLRTPSLRFVECTRTVLPDELVLSDGLIVQAGGFSRIPERLEIGGDLGWRCGYDLVLPEGTRVGGDAVVDAPSVVVGAGSTFGSDLVLGGGEVVLGEGLRVAGMLEGKSIRHVPAGGRIGSFAPGIGLARIGRDCVFGRLDGPLPAIRELPPGLVVEGDLDLSRSTMTELPPDLVVGKFVMLPDQLVGARLPAGIVAAIDREYRRLPHSGRDEGSAASCTG